MLFRHLHHLTLSTTTTLQFTTTTTNTLLFLTFLYQHTPPVHPLWRPIYTTNIHFFFFPPFILHVTNQNHPSNRPSNNYCTPWKLSTDTLLPAMVTLYTVISSQKSGKISKIPKNGIYCPKKLAWTFPASIWTIPGG